MIRQESREDSKDGTRFEVYRIVRRKEISEGQEKGKNTTKSWCSEKDRAIKKDNKYKIMVKQIIRRKTESEKIEKSQQHLNIGKYSGGKPPLGL